MPCRQGGIEHQCDLIDLGTLLRVLHGLGICDQAGLGDQKIFDDPQTVRSDRAARLGDLHDRIDQTLDDLGLGRTPRELDRRVNPALGEENVA